MSFSPIPSLTGIRDSLLRRVLEAVKINLEILIAQRGSGEDKAVIQGELDTTLTDYYTKGQTNSLLNSKADKVPDATEDNFASLDTEGNLKDSGKSSADYYEKTEVDGLLDQKANKVATPTAGNFASLDAEGDIQDSGKSPADYYTKTETDNALAGKTDKVDTPTAGNFAGLDASGNLTDSGKGPADYYTATEVDTALADKANLAGDEAQDFAVHDLIMRDRTTGQLYHVYIDNGAWYFNPV